MQYPQTPVFNQPQQQRRGNGLLGGLANIFSLVSALFPNPVTPALGGAARLMGGDAGGVEGIAQAITGMQGGEQQQGNIGPKQEDGGPQIQSKPQGNIGPAAPAQQAQQQPGQVKTKDIATGEGGGQQGGSGGGSSTPETNPFSLYSGMTLDEMYQMHPELQSMFPLLLQQLPSYGGQA